MRWVGSALVGLAVSSWMGGGFLALDTRDDVWLAVMAFGLVALLPLGWLALRRGNRGADNAWHGRFGAAMAIATVGSLGLALYSQSAIHNASGQRLGLMIMGGGALFFGLLAALAFRAAGRIPPVD